MKKPILAFTYLLCAAFCAANTFDNGESAVLMDALYGVSRPDFGEMSRTAGRQETDTFSAYVPNEIIVKFKEGAAAKLEDELRIKTRVDELKLTGSLDELNRRYRLRNIKGIFKNFKERRRQSEALMYKDKAALSGRELRLFTRLKRAAGRASVPALDRIYRLRVRLENGQRLEDVVEAYRSSPDVEYAELNYIVSACLEPNDPNYPVQWPLNNTGQMYPESGSYNHPPGTIDCDIDAPQAWDVYTGSSDTIVAVIDTGVDYDHRDLAGNIWVNETELNGSAGVDDDENGYVDDIYGYDFINEDNNPKDDHGHGTHCAGIIGASANNGLDIAGVCWDAKIMPLKFLGSGGSGDVADAIEAFYYAVENGADVISNSWGGGGYVESMREAIDYAHSQGVVLVAAAGNDNSNSPMYPAYYEHMIAVAATNSNDQRAPFSNYGDWVDVAAPGVDILSLRAGGTSMGTVYDAYKTVASGTSMACPCVAGACSLLISTNPALTTDEVYDILMQTVGPIADGICLSDGRINLFNAILAVTTSKGNIRFDSYYYSCSSTVTVRVADRDLKGNGGEEITVTTSGGDTETVLLTETDSNVGVFEGTILTASGEPNDEDGILQLSHGQVITGTYEDANDGSGSAVTVTDTATADCQWPVISSVQVDAAGPEPTITFETDEPASVKLFCGLSCAEPNSFMKVCLPLATSHSMMLTGVSPYTEYFFIIKAVDAAGNETTDANSGQCYSFSTDGPGDIYVPGNYDAIQEAVERSWDGGVVWIADGIYTGTGNRDIDFMGKAVTVRSENGPENCIIDCNGTESDPHRGFKFHTGEGPNSVVDGITIINGYAPLEIILAFEWSVGGGISCIFSSPVITNCRISNNGAGDFGGGISCYDNSPVISDCIISGNSSGYYGGGIYSSWGTPTITHCIITDNWAYSSGGGVRCWNNEPTIEHCTVVGNSAGNNGGGVVCDGWSSTTIANCVLWDDDAAYGPEVALRSSAYPSELLLSYNDIEGGEEDVYVETGCTLEWGPGNIDTDPCLADAANGDYHLKSQTGRWDPNQNDWVYDSVTSRCIDAGSPGWPLNDEPNMPDNVRVDMGAYGGTTEASKTPAGWGLLADLTNDGIVNFADFAYQADDWLTNDDKQPGDLDRNGIVDLADLALFTDDWLMETSWY